MKNYQVVIVGLLSIVALFQFGPAPVSAETQYSGTVAIFQDAFNLDVGPSSQSLILVFGKADELEDAFSSAIGGLASFSFDFAENADPLQLTAQKAFQFAALPDETADTLSATLLDGQFQDFDVAQTVAFQPGDLLVFKDESKRIITLTVQSSPPAQQAAAQATDSSQVPEPGTFLLFGLGLMGFLAVMRYKRRRP